MEANRNTIICSFLSAVVAAVLAVFVYNQVVVKPQMAHLNKQIVQLTQTAAYNATVLDRHAEVIERLSGTVNRNEAAADSLTNTVNDNANVANQNAVEANYNASLQPHY